MPRAHLGCCLEPEGLKHCSIHEIQCKACNLSTINPLNYTDYTYLIYLYPVVDLAIPSRLCCFLWAWTEKTNEWSQSWLHRIVWALCHRSRHHQPGMAGMAGTAQLSSECTKSKKIDQIWIGRTEFGEHPLNFAKKTFAPALYDVHYFIMLQNLSPKLSWSLPFSTRCSAASANATTSRRWSLLQEAKSLTHRILL